MKIFIDSADIKEIKKYLSWGVCDGVTTNPSICLKCGVTGGVPGILKKFKEIARLINPRPLSVEVTSEEPKEIIGQAKKYAKLAKNIVVKITVTDSHGNPLLQTIKRLVSQGIRVNVTAMTTFNQAILAAKTIDAGLKVSAKPNIPNYVSIFAGRISEEHGIKHSFDVISDVRNWLDTYGLAGIEIIVGSIRTPENVEFWAKTGAHILTIPPEVIGKSLVSARTKETIAQFINDAKKSIKQLN